MIKQQTAEWTTTDPPTLYISKDSFPQLILSSKSPIPPKYHKELQGKIDEVIPQEDYLILSRADLVSCNVREEVINMWIATIKVYNNTLT